MEGYNLSNTCSSNCQEREDGANEIELEIRNRSNANTKEQNEKRELYAQAARDIICAILVG